MADAATAVRLHLRRGIGWGVYGALTVVVLVLAVASVVGYLQTGRYGSAAVVAVVGLALATFLAVVTSAMVVPALTADAAGVRGRLPRGTTFDAGWDEITVDVDGTRPATIRLDVGEESVTVNGRSWVGFGEFVLLLADTPGAVERLTPAARREVVRLRGPRARSAARRCLRRRSGGETSGRP